MNIRAVKQFVEQVINSDGYVSIKGFDQFKNDPEAIEAILSQIKSALQNRPDLIDIYRSLINRVSDFIKEAVAELLACPICKELFNSEYAAICRRDNQTKICSKCGSRQATTDLLKQLKGHKIRCQANYDCSKCKQYV